MSEIALTFAGSRSARANTAFDGRQADGSDLLMLQQLLAIQSTVSDLLRQVPPGWASFTASSERCPLNYSPGSAAAVAKLANLSAQPCGCHRRPRAGMQLEASAYPRHQPSYVRIFAKRSSVASVGLRRPLSKWLR